MNKLVLIAIFIISLTCAIGTVLLSPERTNLGEKNNMNEIEFKLKISISEPIIINDLADRLAKYLFHIYGPGVNVVVTEL